MQFLTHDPTNSPAEFVVNGSSIPEVDFDVGESYAGLLPIGDTNDLDQLFFWFFPSANHIVEKEIVIWLTGGVRSIWCASFKLIADILSPDVRQLESCSNQTDQCSGRRESINPCETNGAGIK
jgi:hypothetical protein